MGGNSSASHISIMINTFFNLNKKKDNILKKSEIPNEFFSRFFKNIFQNFGSFLSSLFSKKGGNSTKTPETRSSNFPPTTKSGKSSSSWPTISPDWSSHWTTGNNSLFSIFIRTESEEQKNSIIEQIQQIIKNCFENVSVEVIQDWLFILYLIWQQNDIRKVQSLLAPILESFSLIEPSFKLNRYIAIYRLLCRNYGQFFP